MPKGTVKLTFSNKKRYTYPIDVPEPTEPVIAVAVSKQILNSQVKKGMKRQSGGLPCYNLVTDLLRKQNIRYNLPKSEKSKCEFCNGTGYDMTGHPANPEKTNCPSCKGTGFIDEPIASSKEQAFLKAKLANESSPFIETKCSECDGTGEIRSFTPSDGCVHRKCEDCNGHGVVYLRTVYRVGKNTDRQLIVESDSTSPDNAKLIHDHLTKLFGYRFHVVKTTHGYHFIGTHLYSRIAEWIDANCYVLDPDIELPEVYAQALINFDKKIREYGNGQADKEFFEQSFKKSDLYNGVGDFDVLYTVLSIKYKKSTLRISKKHKDDKYKEVI